MIHKIFEYYEALQNINNIEELSNMEYNKRIDNICDNITYNDNIITLKIGEKKITINTKKINFNVTTFTKLKNTIINKKKNIIIDNEFLKNNFTSSTILNFYIDEKKINIKPNYKPIVYYLYTHFVKDRDELLKKSVLAIVEGEKKHANFNYIELLNISVPDTCANKMIKEIINISKIYKINIMLDIQLSNKSIVKYKSS